MGLSKNLSYQYNKEPYVTGDLSSLYEGKHVLCQREYPLHSAEVFGGPGNISNIDSQLFLSKDSPDSFAVPLIEIGTDEQ